MEEVKFLSRMRTRAMHNPPRHKRRSRQQTQGEIDDNLYEKFLNFMTRTKLQRLKEKLVNYYGRNFAIKYDSKYNFLEQWQQHHHKQQQIFYDILESHNIITQTISLLVMILNVMLVWTITVDRIFRGEAEQSEFQTFTLVVGIVSRVASIILKGNLQYKRSKSRITFQKILKIGAKDVACLLYFILNYFEGKPNAEIVMVLQLFVCIYLYFQSRKYYKFVRVIELALIYEYQFKIIDLMVNLLIITHFLSLLLFTSTKFNQSINWIMSLGIAEDHYLTKYVYSLYFCSTTILTIGYGDITPKNRSEVLVVMLVQFFGVIIFGYLISEIGHTLSTIRTKEEKLEKDLMTLNKMRGYYGLEGALINRTKGYLMTNKNAITQLTPQQENTLLSKLNQDLRNVIISDKSLAIVKTSIFFLCRWSKEMQTVVASHLQKSLYAPKERLLQPQGQERIYIIKQGKIEIYLDRFGQNKRYYRRLLKTIRADQKSSISDNIYGYTAVITERNCSLNAEASEFTSCFYIDKRDFLRSVHNSNIDFEYYHEIKNRIDQAECVEAFEVPNIKNIREHYNPSKAILVRKELSNLRKMTNKRSYTVRHKKCKFSKHYFQDMNDILEKISNRIIENSLDALKEFQISVSDQINLEQNQTSALNEGTFADYCIQKQAETQIKTLVKINSSITELKKEKTKAETISRNIDNYIAEESEMLARAVKKTFLGQFEKAREYKNFFSYNNINEVLRKLENESYNCRPNNIFISNLKMYSERNIINLFERDSKM